MVITLDIETIPCQRPGLLEEIRQTITPPGNISKPESIKKWMEDEVLAGNADRVAAYCNEDVEATREVYRRMTFAAAA